MEGDTRAACKTGAVSRQSAIDTVVGGLTISTIWVVVADMSGRLREHAVMNPPNTRHHKTPTGCGVIADRFPGEPRITAQNP